MLARIE